MSALSTIFFIAIIALCVGVLIYHSPAVTRFRAWNRSTGDGYALGGRAMPRLPAQILPGSLDELAGEVSDGLCIHGPVNNRGALSPSAEILNPNSRSKA